MTTPIKAKKMLPSKPAPIQAAVSDGWNAFDPTAQEEVQEVMHLLGNDVTASATVFNGRIMAILRQNRIEYVTNDQGVSEEQYIPQKGAGVYMNVEEFNDLAMFGVEAKAAYLQNKKTPVERFLGTTKRFKLIVGDATSVSKSILHGIVFAIRQGKKIQSHSKEGKVVSQREWTRGVDLTERQFGKFLAIVPELKMVLAQLQKNADISLDDPANTPPSLMADMVDRKNDNVVKECIRLILADVAEKRPTVLKNPTAALKELQNLSRRVLFAYISDIVTLHPNAQLDVLDIDETVKNFREGDPSDFQAFLDTVPRKQATPSKKVTKITKSPESTAAKRAAISDERGSPKKVRRSSPPVKSNPKKTRQPQIVTISDEEARANEDQEEEEDEEEAYVVEEAEEVYEEEDDD